MNCPYRANTWVRPYTDSHPHYFDLPPVEDWSGAVVGRFYRPLKRR